MTALQTLRTQNAQALATVLEQIRTKQSALDQALEAPGANAAALGLLTRTSGADGGFGRRFAGRRRFGPR